MSCRHPKSSTTSDGALQGSTVMRQSSAETLVTEEPYELIAHVRICGGAGRVTAGSTRKPTPYSVRSASLPLPGAAHRQRWTDPHAAGDVMQASQMMERC